MGYPAKVPSPEMVDSTTARHYHELMEESVLARNRGNHWEAQKLATAAHKWAMNERNRLQRLAHARESLVSATKRLEATWDKDPECTTIAELHERHPEFRSVITAWEKANQLVRELDVPQPDGVTSR